MSTAAWSSLHTSSRTKRSFTVSNRGFKSKYFQMTSGSWSPVREKRRGSSECLLSELQWHSQTQTHVSASRWGTVDTYTLTHRLWISAIWGQKKGDSSRRHFDSIPTSLLSVSFCHCFLYVTDTLALCFYCLLFTITALLLLVFRTHYNRNRCNILKCSTVIQIHNV